MISDLQVATADDGKRLVVYPLELSLRDLFAMAALQGMLAATAEYVKASPEGMDAAEFLSKSVYEIADACLAERAK